MGRHAMPEQATDVALRLDGVCKTFRSGLTGRGPRVNALSGIDLTVRSGTVHALLGPNGAGKTTTVRAVATLMRPDSGSVVVDSVDAVAEPDRVREMIGVSGQYAAVDGNLTGFENLRMVAQLYGHRRRAAAERARAMIADLRLTDAADRPMRTYSGGMRRRLDLAGALINEPSLVILDEPTTGLDPRGRRQMWEVITEQVAAGTTVLLTTQYLEEADALADEITVIDRGTVRARGTAAELKATTAQSILTVEVAGDGDDARVRSALAEVGLGAPHRVDSRTWSVAVADGSRSAVAAVRVCDGLGIDVVDATVSTPTLDDVFLEITGRTESSAAPREDENTADENPTADRGTERLERV
ncbi:ATP-binding cassette domain-containing protein [Gordonia sp. PKS22-38]|uniref:ATP-binding cassette domain-containing protein n=1 Tax=Gordonia prachuapensis TaxID=3115651 RepID=A0ABU7MMP6_9ACTN|nr:ATP-binding cassette domain-containing protein [Gordonia sp. PKS22-38]